MKNWNLDSVIDNLSEAIKSNYGRNVRAKLKGRILNSPWRLIPDVSNLTVEVGLPQPLFYHFGILKREGTKLIMEPYKNRDLNRFAVHQVMRLRKYKDESPAKYWRLAQSLMKRSNVFRTLAINHVFTNWHRKYPLEFIIGVNRKVSKLINEKVDSLDFTRVYIPKDDKRWRPLGVPKPEWRLLLHMWSNFITYFVQDRLHNQHGFLPGRGTWSAWKQLMEEDVMNQPYVYEWDFKNFFNQIWSNRITDELKKLGVPMEVCYFLENINRSDVKLPHKDQRKLNEDFFDNQRTSHEMYRQGLANPDHPSLLWIKEFQRENPELLKQFMKEDECETIEEYLQLQWALLDGFNMSIGKSAKIETDFNGVAQGCPTSPILSNLIQDIWIRTNPARVIAYADDSVGYSSHYFNSPPPEDTGIIINPNKSGWIRYQGKTIRPLKFLGLIYDGVTLKASTKKGSNLEATNEILSMLELFDQIRYDYSLSFGEAIDFILNERGSFGFYGDMKSQQNWERWFCSKLGGFIHSRFYLNDWFNPKIEQCFKYKYEKKSWSDTKLSKITRMKTGERYRDAYGKWYNPIEHKYMLTVFNSTSFASRSLIEIFRSNTGKKERKPIGVFLKRGFKRPNISSIIDTFSKKKR